MEKTYLIADTHFGDDRIRRYESRPFPDTAQMDEALIQRWNSVVGPEDRVYVLGDFGGDGYETEVLSRLRGRKFLVKGNHDTRTNAEYRTFGFEEVYDHPIILDGFWILSHEALYVNANMPYANIFGHVHNTPLIRDFSSQHYCVSVERLDYAPIDLELVKRTVFECSKAGD